jgi:hypothetical protein
MMPVDCLKTGTMYTTFSSTFKSETAGDKKFYFTVNKQTGDAVPVYEGKINDDKTVPKFKMRKDEAGEWKISGEKIPAWVIAMEKDFGTRIEASVGGR